MEKKISIFIPGRLKSERLPNKLILPLGDSNLWNEACKKLSMLPDKYDKIAFTADKELIDIAKNYPNIRIIHRSPETSNIDGPGTEIFKDLKNVDCTHLMYFHPCFAFVDVNHIVEALKTFESSDNVDYMTSVKQFKNWLYKSNEQIVDIDESNWSTKTVHDYWIPTHNFFIFNKNEFFETGQILPKGHSLYEMSEKDSIDVNTEEEYRYVKWRFEHENNR